MPTSYRSSGSPDRAVREMAEEIAHLKRRIKLVERGNRATQLGRSSIENDYLSVYDAAGLERARLGLQEDGTFVPGTSRNNPNPPPVPAAASVVPTKAGLRVDSVGTATGEPWPTDLSHLNVYVDAALRGSIVQQPGFFIVGPLTYVDHVVHLTAVNLSGKESAASVTTTARPDQVIADGNDLADDIILARHIAANQIDAGHIQAGIISADLLAALLVLTSRLVVGDPNGARLEINPTTGLQQFDAAGVVLTEFDDQGNALVTGSIRSGNTGRRIEIEPTGDMFFHPTDGGDPAAITSNDQFLSFAGPIQSIFGIDLQSYQYLGQGTIGLAVGPPPTFFVEAPKAELALEVDSGRASLRGSTTQIRADSRFSSSPTASLGNIDSSGGDVADSIVNFIYRGSGGGAGGAGGQPQLIAPAHDVGLQWDSGELSVRNSSGGYAPIRASSFPTSSSMTAKTNIAGLSFDPLAVVDDAPVSEWEYRTDHHRPSKPSLKQFWHLGPGLPEPAPKDVDWEFDHPPPPRHIGPMAEDLPPQLVSTPPGSDEVEVDLRDMVGVLWAAVRALSAKVDALAAQNT